MAKFELNINNQTYQVEAAPDTPLLWVLRDELGLKGTKFGCGKSLCGACTVHLDGVAVRSCSKAISTLGNAKITSIEGLSEDGSHPVQQAWIAEDVAQCGYCQTGQIMTVAALLDKTPHPDEQLINEAMSGHICRCGTYPRVRKAIRSLVGKEI